MQLKVTGLLHDREAAKKTIEELKGAGFTDRSILVAMPTKPSRKVLLRRLTHEP